ncbi:MAG: hypothetical protein AB7V07_08520 [Candidatus Delongbacteria bacterium]
MRNKALLTVILFCLIAGVLFFFNIQKGQEKSQHINQEKSQEMTSVNYQLGTSVIFAKNGNITDYIPDSKLSGWSKPESTHTWTNGNEAVLSVNVSDSKDKNLRLRLKASPFLGGKLKQQEVGVHVNDTKVAHWSVAKNDWYEAVIPADVNKDGKLMIKFTISDPTSPKEIGMSKDPRKLGIDVKEMVITEGQEIKNVNYELGTSVIFAKNGNSTDFIPDPKLSGWSQPESSFTWTNGNEAVLSVNVNNSKDKNLRLRLKASPYLGGKLKQQEVGVHVNETKVAHWSIAKADWYEAVIPADVNKDGKLMIKFTISDPASPKEVGKSKDSRKLGIAVKEMIITDK